MRASTRAATELWEPPVRRRTPSNSNLLAVDEVAGELEGGEPFGPYLVYEQLGTGGMATVHRAEKRALGGFRKVVALKRLTPRAARMPDFVESFEQEARLASKLCHPNIARAFDHGVIDGTHFIAMELVAGPTLKQTMVQSRSAAGAIPAPIVIEIMAQLCDALAHAHSFGVIHRDVSPANVIVAAGGVVKLIDFGLAKVPRSRLRTEDGIIKGKFAYLAPEYTEGRLDHRVDLFSAGVVAHELLTGRPLFEAASNQEVIRNVRLAPIRPPSAWNPHVSRELDDIVMTALRRDPEARWQNAGAMATALRANAREHRQTADSRDVHAWVEWAFTREPRRDTTNISRMVDALWVEHLEELARSA